MQFTQSFLAVLALAATAVSGLPAEMSEENLSVIEAREDIYNGKAHLHDAAAKPVSGAKCTGNWKDSDIVVTLSPAWTQKLKESCHQHLELKDVDTGKTTVAKFGGLCKSCKGNDMAVSGEIWKRTAPHKGKEFKVKWRQCPTSGGCGRFPPL